MDERRISPAGDPFTAAEQDRPCCCNDGWVTIGQEVIGPETGEETIEYALYLCRRCANYADWIRRHKELDKVEARLRRAMEDYSKAR